MDLEYFSKWIGILSWTRLDVDFLYFDFRWNGIQLLLAGSSSDFQYFNVMVLG